VCKASIAAVLLALGIVSLVQEGTNAMVIPPASSLPTLAMPAIETVAVRTDVTVTRHVAVRHRGVAVRARHVAVGTSQFDIEVSQPVGPILWWAGAALWL
jgi:hypothetical protein